MPDYVFLSYSRADRTYVDSLTHRLVAEGIPFWNDHELEYHGGWASTLEEHLAGAAVVVVVVTPQAMTSPRVDRALRHARELGKPILALVRRPATAPLLDESPSEDVTSGAMPSAAFYEQVRRHTGTAAPGNRSPDSWPPPWAPGARLPRLLDPIPRTPAENWGICGLLAAAVILAAAGSFSGQWHRFLAFPAFGIPDVLFAWFRWRRFRLGGRWSADVRATILLTGLTLYLSVVPFTRAGHTAGPFLRAGLPVAAVLGWAAAAVWTAQVVRDRPR